MEVSRLEHMAQLSACACLPAVAAKHMHALGIARLVRVGHAPRVLQAVAYFPALKLALTQRHITAAGGHVGRPDMALRVAARAHLERTQDGPCAALAALLPRHQLPAAEDGGRGGRGAP